MSLQTETSRVLDDAGRSLLFTDARTVNNFSDTAVTDDELAQIWDLAKWPPTAANTQPLRVVYVRSDSAKTRLLAHMAEGNVDKTASAPAVAILAVDTEFHQHIPTLLPFKPELKDVFAANDDARVAAARFNGALQAGYFLLAVRAAGLWAGPMGGFDSDAVDADFFPDGTLRSILVVNIGHPGENAYFDRLPRLENNSVVEWA